jgi:hypothetical protein
MQAEDFELITYHGPITLRLEPLNTKPDMTRNTSSGLDRRNFLSASMAAAVSGPVAAADKTPPRRSSYSIKPVQAWDPAKNTFSPFFPIGWYSFGPQARIEEIAENGANSAVYAGLGSESWHRSDTLKRLDVAHKLGVKVVLGLGGSVVGKVVLGQPKTYGVIPEYVKTFNRHPAMLGWQMGDEFSEGAAPRINDTTALLKQLGSRHPTWQVHPHTWSHGQVRKLMARTDVCTYDGYTYLEGLGEFHTHSSARVLAWQQAKADLIQAEGWAGNVNVTQAVGCQCGTAKFRFPTAREYRWNVFSAIATAGARGTMNWIYSYSGGFYANDPKRFFRFRDDVVKPVNQEQRMIARGMETGYNVGEVRSNHDTLTRTTIPPAGGNHRPYNSLGHILLHDAKAGKYFLLATNNEPKPLDISLSLDKLPISLKSLEARDTHRKRTLTLHRNNRQGFVLRDKLAPYDVALFVLS